MRTLPRLGQIDFHSHRALAAYLREAVQNRIRDEHRRIARHGVTDALSDALVDPTRSPFEQVFAAELEERYRRALNGLRDDERALIVGHIELGHSHQQLACMTGRSRNAARMALVRAIERLAEKMSEGGK